MSGESLDCIVIGSGPSGAACAAGLIAAGRRVTILDTGLEMEPDKLSVVNAVRASADVLRPEQAHWAAAPAEGQIPRKLIFGSDFPFQRAQEEMRIALDGVGLEPSFAFGGFSNIWGAAVMPYAERDIAAWPIRLADLAPHYEACARMLGFAAEADDLAEDFPLYCEPHGQLPRSVQAQKLLRNLERHRKALRAKAVRFGSARIAARAKECVRCGLCLHGCPDNLIFKTPHWLEPHIASGRLDYRAGVAIEIVAPEQGGARVLGRDINTNEPISLSARRVFIAGGVIPTTAILMRSAGLHGQSVLLRDSQYFLLPLLTAFMAPNVSEERLHTMCQVFLDLTSEAFGDVATRFLQVYSYNSMLGAEAKKKLGPLAPLLLARLMLVQGYLHSDLSSSIQVTLDGGPESDQIRLRALLNPAARDAVDRVIAKLASLFRYTGAMPVAPLLRMGEPGRGFHTGCSFPMSAQPRATETDTLGRPFGWQRIHAVDASVLPSIAATTITYTVMANAHRIGAAAARLD